jgi:CubicO group peptidase (beta-lactamase class C family)
VPSLTTLVTIGAQVTVGDEFAPRRSSARHMTTTGFSKEGLVRLDRVMAGHAGVGAAGLVWGVARDGDVHVDVAGSAEEGGGTPIARDTIFRISSMTKPVTAVAAMILVEECRLRLDDPVDELLPELADRRVLRDPAGPLDDTVAAVRPITLRDVLTFRLGLGMDLAHWDRPQPVLERAAELGLGAGPPQPAGPPPTDEWIRRLGTLPLSYQPGERWLYHIGADVAGVLIERAAGQPFDAFLREHIFEPLGMVDTAFHVPADRRGRFGPTCFADPTSGAVSVFDPADGQWAAPPAFPGGGAGLVSTVDDYLAFAEMMIAGGTRGGVRILSPASVGLMTTAHVAEGPDPHGDRGWGFGMGVQLRRVDVGGSVGTYGWDGGLGSVWRNDPVQRLVAVLLTNRMWSSPHLPPVAQDLLTCAAAACD